MNYNRGSLVICIDGKFDDTITNGILFKPLKGQIYTIRNVKQTSNGLGLLLDEIVNTPIKFKNGVYEPCFSISRFVPITESYNTYSLKNVAKNI